MTSLARAGLCIWLALGWTLAGAVLPTGDRPFESIQAEWQFHLKQAEAELKSGGRDWLQLEDMRPQLAELAGVANAYATDRAGLIKEARVLLEALGKEPGEGQPLEAPEVARERLNLHQKITELDGQRKHAELTAARATALQNDINQRLRNLLAYRLSRRDISPLSPAVLAAAWPQARDVLGSLAEVPRREWAPASLTKEGRERGIGTAVGFVIIVLLSWLARRWVAPRARRGDLSPPPGIGQRLGAAVAVFTGCGLLPALPFLFVLFRVLNYSAAIGLAGELLAAMCAGIAFIFGVYGLGLAALAPNSHGYWRLADLRDQAVRPLFERMLILAVLLAVVCVVAYPAGQRLEIGAELHAVFDLLVKAMLAASVYALLQTRLWRPHGPRRDKRKRWMYLRRAVRWLALLTPVVAAMGFRDASGYIAWNLILGLLLFGALAALRGLARDSIDLLIGEAVEQPGEALDTAPGSGILYFWLRTLVDIVLFVTLVVVMLPSLGVDWTTVRGVLQQAFSGYQIGDFTLNIGDVLIAVLGFGAILFAARWLRNILETRVLPHTNWRDGVKTLVLTAEGYLGLVLAALFMVSALGLDFSKLALVAGALSLGLGFGLKTIVNNFVSGLILLVERPIKVGDWIVVGQDSGYVRRIKVRATEIESFQRASIFVPNSALLSSALVNWTHKSMVARVAVRVGVAYGSNTRKVRDLLVECAIAQEMVLKRPSPYVLFDHFGDDGLEFEVHAFIRDANYVRRVASDIRFALNRAFGKHGISIPFPQRVVHFESPEAS